MAKKACMNCECWQTLEDDELAKGEADGAPIGECHARAPQIDPDSRDLRDDTRGALGAWPLTLPTDYCHHDFVELKAV